MSSSRFRRPLALAATVAVSATIALGGTGTANASHAGDGSGTLTASGGGKLVFPNGNELNWISGINDAAWSPDGSRFVFLENDGAIRTRRYDEPFHANPKWLVEANGSTRSHPTWRGKNGFGIAWAENATGEWRILFGSSSPHCCIAIDHGLGEFGPYGQVPPQPGYHDTHPDGGDNNLIVFQRRSTGGGTAAVWLYDPQAPTTTRLVVDDAEEPSISPDGKRVAFARAVGGSRLIFTTDLSGGDLVQVTNAGGGTVVHSHPTWSPDGQTIAFNTSAAVSTVPADGSAAPTAATVTGMPAYQSQQENLVVRLAGSSRFGTAGAVSQSLWKTYGDDLDKRLQAESVVLSRSDNFADALGGATLASAKQGPLLLTTPSTLNPITAAEIDRVLKPGGTVYVLGGTGAVSATVETQLKTRGFAVKRLAGANRYDTSIAIADAVVNYDPASGQPRVWPDYVLVATGANFPDALAAGAAAGSFNWPGSGTSAVILLTQDAKLPAATQQYLDGWTATHTGDRDAPYAVGVQAVQAVGARYAHYRLSGANRYETALIVAHWFFGGNAVAGVATGTNWPDALAGGALMATLNGPLLLTVGSGSSLNTFTAFGLDGSSGSFGTAFIFGGTGAVNDTLANQTGDLISGPAGFATLTVTESGSLGGGPTLRATAGTTLRTPTTNDPGTDRKTPKKIEATPELHPAQG